MFCIICKPIVEMQLEDEKAVQRIDIDCVTDSVTVEFEFSLITGEEIKNRLEKSATNCKESSIIIKSSEFPLQFSIFSYDAI
jgi:hypothetical protein